MRAVALLLLSLCATHAVAAELYAARTIVTGMDQRSRPDGLRRALAQVLAKVAGNAALLDDPRVAALDPTRTLVSVAYLDRMSDQPKHDEQGTRDRPYDLIARFDPAGTDAMVRALGEEPWPEPRPLLAMDVTVEPRRGPPMPLRGDTDPDERHRAALLDAAARLGLAVALPLQSGSPAVPAGSVAIHGTVRWSEPDAGWTAVWEIEVGGARYRWGRAGTSFDAAYRDAVAGAAGLLSGHRPEIALPRERI